MKSIAGWVPWLIIVVLSVGSGWYVRKLRGEISRLKAREAAASAPAAATPTAAAPTAAPAGSWTLTEAERAAMLFELGGDGTSTSNAVWFVTDTRNVGAVSMQRSLRAVFEEAGWQVRGNSPASFPLKPGIFFLMADDEPPAFVQTAHRAFDSAGIPMSAGRGYRAFYNEMRAKDAAWRGFEMAPDQPFVVVVGRRPEGAPAAPAPAPTPLPE